MQAALKMMRVPAVAAGLGSNLSVRKVVRFASRCSALLALLCLHICRKRDSIEGDAGLRAGQHKLGTKARKPHSLKAECADKSEKWGFLDLSRIEQRWEVRAQQSYAAHNSVMSQCLFEVALEDTAKRVCLRGMATCFIFLGGRLLVLAQARGGWVAGTLGWQAANGGSTGLGVHVCGGGPLGDAAHSTHGGSTGMRCRTDC